MDEDGEFELTAEMLIHDDVDDEQTLIEAEALENVGEAEEEIADLQQESELPLDELLKRYGYSFPDENTEEAAAEGGGEGEGEEEKEKRDVVGVKRVRVKDRKGLEDDTEKETEASAVKRVKVEEELDQDVRVRMERESRQGVLQRRVEGLIHAKVDTAGMDSTDNEEKLESTRHTARNEREGTCVQLQSDEAISSDAMVAASNCSTATDSSDHKYIPRTKLISSDSCSTPPFEKHQSVSSLLPPSCHRTQSEDTSIGTTDRSCAVETLDSPVESSLFLASTGGLALGQPLLHEKVEVSLVECDTDQSCASGNLVQEGSRQCEEQEGGGGGGVDSDEVGCGGEGGAEERIDTIDVPREEGGREVFCGDGGGDVLLVGDLVDVGERGNGAHGVRAGAEERSPKEMDGYSSDHLSSSDVRVYTPSNSSLSLQTSSSASEASRTRTDIKSRLRPEVPERRSMRLMANDERALDSYFSSFFDDEEADEEYVPIEDWKQEIRVGCSYQVEVDDRPSLQPYPTHTDRLLWRPQIPEEKVVSYLKSVSTVLRPGSGNSSWDTEQALQLLQECQHDVQRAMDVVQEQGLSTGTRPWTEEECDDFEQGLRVSGKDFFQLKNQVPSRSVKELVEFYYFWKKSKRYDDFIQHGKIGKKKIPFQPGQVYDFMDNYLNMQDSEATDLHYATTTVYAEHKKESV